MNHNLKQTTSQVHKSKNKFLMKSKDKLNININTDDHISNDYLYVWDELNCRPNKSSFHGYFLPDTFYEYINSMDFVEINSFIDMIPSEEQALINQKYFGVIDSDIYLTFTHLDKEHENTTIGEVSFFYTSKRSEKIQEILEKLNSITLLQDEMIEIEGTKQNLFIINLTQNGFELESLDLNRNHEDIEFYYENETLKKIKKSIKSINSETKGISIILGERGCGKTNLLSYFSTKSDKKFLFLPSNAIESTLGNPEFRRFLKGHKNSVLVIDDAELHFSQMYSKSTFFTNNLLQLVEGLYSDSLSLNVILSLNCLLLEIDKTITESNQISNIIEVGKLSVEKIEELCEFLDKKNKIKVPTKLVEVLKNTKSQINKTEFGFN